MSEIPEKIKNLSPEQLKSIAAMNVEKGEAIVGIWATVNGRGTGVFKLPADKTKN